MAARAYLAVCAIFRNEAPYLAEWLEFHRVVGVERFFLYDNESTDGYRDVLGPYVDDGVVALREWPGVSVQRAAYDDCLLAHRDEARWIAFIDVDEFLFSPGGRGVPDLLRAYEDAPGVGVGALHFYTSGHRTRPPGLVIENYVARAGNPTTWVKSVVDPRRAVRCVSAHTFAYASGHAVDMARQPFEQPMGRHPIRPLRINHYYTKSEEEFLEKWSQPRADSGRPRPPIPLERLRAIAERQLADRAILRYVPAVRQALDERALRARLPG